MRTFKKALLVIILLLGIWCSAQQGLNYKAIIKDSNGNVVANQNIDVEFTILQGQTIVYKEENSTFSNDIGTINLLIGNGNVVVGNFSNIEWEASGLKLNVQVNTGNGLKDMGSTFFGSVPYAKQAEKALNVSGLEVIDEGNGPGWRLVGRNPEYYGNIGLGAIDLSTSRNNSTIKGATADYAVAIGLDSRATAPYSTAIGNTAVTKDINAIALGVQAVAEGRGSRAFGFYTSAIGDYSSTFGNDIAAYSYRETVLGSYNVQYTPNSNSAWDQNDPLLVVGNGSSSTNRNNAFTILKNGNIGIQTHLPQSKLHITGGVDANLNDTSGYLTIGSTENINLVLDNNEILARNNGSNATLYIQTEGGATSFGGSMYLNGELLHSSDRRLKTNIEDLPYGLNEILALQPKAYHWKNKIKHHKSLGLIAQEVKDILEELVITKDDENGTLAVNYTELIPILINAIKEQQETIKELKNNNEDFKTRLEKIETLVLSNN